MKSLFLVLLLILGSCSSDYFADPADFDAFHFHKLTVESNQSKYSVGEKVTLVASVVPEKTDNIRIYRDRTKSFRLSIRAGINGNVDINDNEFTNSLTKPRDGDIIDVIEISPVQPYQLVIEGHVLKGRADGITFDFGEFGVFEKFNANEYRVWGFWMPIDFHPIDPLEDFTESIVISIH